MFKLFGSIWPCRWILCVSLVVVMAGCSFGGGAAEEEFELMAFEEEGGVGDVGDGALEQPLVHDVSVEPLILEELNYLLSHQAWLETLRQLNRDMLVMLESGDGDIGLPWVVDVHEVTRESDELFAFVLGADIPATQAPAHFEIYLSALQTVQMMAYGSDRLLASALVVGPSGRLVSDLTVDDGVRFKTYSREASFFLRDAETLLEDDLEAVGDAISNVGLR